MRGSPFWKFAGNFQVPHGYQIYSAQPAVAFLVGRPRRAAYQNTAVVASTRSTYPHLLFECVAVVEL